MSDVFDRIDLSLNPDSEEEFRRRRYVVEDGIETPVHLREIGQSLISASDEDPDDVVAKLNTAYHLSKMLGRPLEDVYLNFDSAVESYFGKATPPQTAWTAISNSFRAATLSTQAADLGYQLWLKRGNDESLVRRINDIHAQMPPVDDVKRSLPVAALKLAAQFLPSQLESFRAGIVQGAGTAAAAAIMAGPKAAPLALSGVGSLALPAIVSMAFGVGATAGSAERARQLETGALYFDLLRYRDSASGGQINPQAAWAFSAAYGALASIVEVVEADFFFKQFPGVRRAIVESLANPADQAARSGVVQEMMGKYIAVANSVAGAKVGTSVKKSAQEALQETMQEGLAVAAEEFAKQVTGRMGGENLTPLTAEEITTRLIDTLVGSAIGMGALNFVPTAADLFIFRDAPAARPSAEGTPTRDAISAQPAPLGRVLGVTSPRKGLAEGLPAQLEVKPMSPKALAEMREKMAVPVPENYQIQSSEIIAGDSYYLKMGERTADPETGKARRVGLVRYRIDSDAMEVHILGYERGSAPNINAALTVALMNRFPGWDIIGESRNPAISSMFQVLKEQNPRGQSAGLQWFEGEAPPRGNITYDHIRTKLGEIKPEWSPDDIEFSVRYLDTLARAIGTTGEEMADGVFSPQIIGDRGAAIAAQGAYGAVTTQMVGDKMRAVIQLSKSANPATWIHEATHTAIFYAQLVRNTSPQADSFLSELEGIFGIENHNWESPVKGWTAQYDGDRSGYEALAYAVEDYFLTRTAPNPRMENLFRRIAQWLRDLYQALKGARYTLSPELERYFDRIFAAPGSPLYEMETARAIAPAGAARQDAQPLATEMPIEVESPQGLDADATPAFPPEELEIYQRINPIKGTAQAMAVPSVSGVEVSGFARELFQLSPQKDTVAAVVSRMKEILVANGVPSSQFMVEESSPGIASISFEGEKYSIQVFSTEQSQDFDLSFNAIENWEPVFNLWAGGVFNREFSDFEQDSRRIKTFDRGRIPSNETGNLEEKVQNEEAKLEQFAGVEDASIIDIKNEAKTFPTWEEFAEYVETFFFIGESSPQMGESERNKFYRDLWEKANRPTDFGGDLHAWVNFLSANDYKGLSDFLAAIWDEILSEELLRYQPEGLQEADEFAARDERRRRVRTEIAEAIQAGAIRIGAKGKTPSKRFLASALGIIKANPEQYAELYGELFSIPSLVAAGQAGVQAKFADIADPRIRDPRLSISQKAAIAEILKHEQVGKDILSGKIVVSDKVETYIKTLVSDGKANAARIKQLEKEIREDEKYLSYWEKQYVAAAARVSQSDNELKKITARMDTLARNERRIPDELIADGAALKRIIATMESQRTRAARRIKNKANLQTVLAKTEEATNIKIKDKARELRKKAAIRLRNYEKKLKATIMAKPSPRVNVLQIMAITDIQMALDPEKRKTLTSATLAQMKETLRKAGVIELEWITEEGKNLGNLTLAELELLSMKITQLKREGRSILANRNEQQKANAEKEKSIIAETLQALPGAAIPGLEPDKETFFGKLASRVREFDYAFTRPQQFARIMDGKENGPNYQLLIRDRDVAYKNEMLQIERRTKALNEAFEKEGMTPAEWYKETVTLEGVGPGRTEKILRKSDLMALELAFRDENSLQAALFGRFFSAQERAEMTEESLFEEGERRFLILRKAIDSVLGEKEGRILDAFSKDAKETGSRLFQVVADVENRIMEVVQNYFPMNRENAVGDPMDVFLSEAIEGRMAGLRRPPKNAFTKTRLKISPKHQTPIKLDLYSTWIKNLQYQEHYIATAAYSKKLDAVYANNFMQEQISAALSHHGVNYVNLYIKEVKNPRALRNLLRWESSIKTLRGSLGAGYLGFRVSSVMKQLATSVWPAMAYSGPIRLAAEAFHCLANPVKFVTDTEKLSVVLRHRVAGLVLDAIRDIHATTDIGAKAAGTLKVGVKGLEIADRVSVSIAWRSVFEKEMATHGDERKAIIAADDMITRTQPSARGIDQSPIYRESGEAAMIFLQFTSTMNVIWNNIRHDLPAAIQDRHYFRAVGIISSYAISGVLLGLLTEGEDIDEEERKKMLGFYAASQFTSATPLVGADVTRLARAMITGEGGRDFPSTIFPAAEEILGGLASITQDPENWERGFGRFANGMGLSVGAPVAAIREYRRVADGDLGALLGRPKSRE